MTPADRTYVDVLRILTRPALVTACGRAVRAVLAGIALALSVWKGLSLTATRSACKVFGAPPPAAREFSPRSPPGQS